MKKGITVLLTSFALFSLVGCTNNEEKTTSVKSSGQEQEVFYKVTFYNYDDTFLYETMVLEGQEAKYSGKTPTKMEGESPDFHYEFRGWDPDISCITSDLITHATFELVVDQQWSPIIFP